MIHKAIPFPPSLLFTLFLAMSLADARPLAAATATPDEITMTVVASELSPDGISYSPIPSASGQKSLTKTQFQELARSDRVSSGTYRSLKLTVSEMSWSLATPPVNSPPCLNNPTDGTVRLPSANTDFYFNTAELGGKTLGHYRAHPPTDGGYPGDQAHPFLLALPIQVINGETTNVDLVIGVQDSLSCDGLSIFSTNPTQTIAGPSVRMKGASSLYLYVDAVGGEIGVANELNDSLTLYSFLPSTLPKGDMMPETIIGPKTRLNLPSAIALSKATDEIIVANRGNDSITFYKQTARNNAEPVRYIGGLYTGLSEPSDLFLDGGEIFTANYGNSTVTVHPLGSSMNSYPARTMTGKFIITPENNRIYFTENGIGVTAFIQAGTYTGGEITAAVYRALRIVSTIGAPYGVSYDSATAKVTITVTIGTGTSVTFDWSNPLSTARDVLGFINSQTFDQSGSMVSDVGHHAQLNKPCGIFVAGNYLYVANQGDNSVTVYDRGASDTGRIAPITKFSTGQTGSCGLFVDSANNEVIVSNSGSGSVTVYTGDPQTVYAIAAGREISTLNYPADVYVDGNNYYVLHRGPNPEMPFVPEIHAVSTNSDSSILSTSMSYHIVSFAVEYKGINFKGYPIAVDVAGLGHADFALDGKVALKFDRKISHEIIEENCLVEQGIDHSGFYGGNADGTFHMVLPGFPGTFQGAVLNDGKAFAASMVDASDRMMVVYGIQFTAGTLDAMPYLTPDGHWRSEGATAVQTEYALTSYFNDLFDVRRPLKNDDMRYLLEIGTARADQSLWYGSSSDANFLPVLNPMGQMRDPESVGGVYREGFVYTFKQKYGTNEFGKFIINVSGEFNDDSKTPFSSGFQGALMEGGGFFIFMRDALVMQETDCNAGRSTDIGFGFGLRQRPAQSFGAAGFTGSYLLSSFGDRYDAGRVLASHRAGLTRMVFDGRGVVRLTSVDNEFGETFSDDVEMQYRVAQRIVPEGGNVKRMSDVLDIYDRSSSAPYASALIGLDGRLLSFYHNPNPGGSANPIRLLGLAIRNSY